MLRKWHIHNKNITSRFEHAYRAMTLSRSVQPILFACLTAITAETYFQSKSQSPSEVDWRRKGAVTQVESQDSCRACWAFAVASAVESHHFIKTGNLVHLSTQNLIDCSNVFGNRGCIKGYAGKSFKYIKANRGINYAKSYPYTNMQRNCRFDRKKPVVSIRGYVKVKENSEENLKEAVATKGPVVVGMYTSSKFFKYAGGIFFDLSCKHQPTNHVMLLVGYGTDEEDGDYWILKNSYGEGWGENGYMRIARNRNDTCGVSSSAFYPLV